ncbi:GNAT family N-acetyltransferase [Brevibacillus formosus]|uniref:Acetyltransferase n=1 Tax=Brevibacillus formosus TaxID=54913 RepID=A0A837KU98_9BACL|nr:GNAT family N-acetyltransferase [Brevibacillus formosus]KLI00496.1 acetyltransferase [Brevibacillus formosus]MED1958810.1 GNAT family N-acetyltransferase [Brevibacillus formosus]PSJ92494.1 N-acetyltransferase [Brevibacillus formosus]GED57883.1 N-acetyltransferase [Brevibacillus formosus]
MEPLRDRSLDLRKVIEADLPIFFTQQLDKSAHEMAAFTVKDPEDIDGFTARWTMILNNDSIVKRAIVRNGQIVGNVLCFELFGLPTIGYWIDKSFWGKGIATNALSLFLEELRIRPVYARVAHDNIASIRVLEKNGFQPFGVDRAFSEVRGEEVEELILIKHT